mgnify:CR=1 FL=1
METAAENERLLVGMITLTGKIIAKADKAVSDRIITEKDLIGQIFREFLFASYFSAQTAIEAQNDIKLVQKSGQSKDSKKKKQSTSSNKSREAAYVLLHKLIKGSTTLMKSFLQE